MVAGAGIAFAVLGFGQQVHAINNINNYEGQLNEVLTAASVYRTSVEQGDGDAMLMNKAAFISKVSGYMGNFVDGLSAGLVGEAAMRAAVSDWSSN